MPVSGNHPLKSTVMSNNSNRRVPNRNAGIIIGSNLNCNNVNRKKPLTFSERISQEIRCMFKYNTGARSYMALLH